MEAQCILGFLLAGRLETRRIAVQPLALAARTFPQAHILLARIYQAEGAESVASLELERYRQAVKDQPCVSCAPRSHKLDRTLH